MAYKINPDLCVACGSCIDECPVEAISAGDVYVIDPDKCMDCGTCAGVCPSEAISAEYSTALTQSDTHSEQGSFHSGTSLTFWCVINLFVEVISAVVRQNNVANNLP